MMKRIVILGCGESGTGAAMLAKKQGFDVFVSDKGLIPDNFKQELNTIGVPFEEGHHTIELILNADEIIKSPGIPDDTSLLIEARQKGIAIINELEFAARYTQAKIIGITRQFILNFCYFVRVNYRQVYLQICFVFFFFH